MVCGFIRKSGVHAHVNGHGIGGGGVACAVRHGAGPDRGMMAINSLGPRRGSAGGGNTGDQKRAADVVPLVTVRCRTAGSRASHEVGDEHRGAVRLCVGRVHAGGKRGNGRGTSRAGCTGDTGA